MKSTGKNSKNFALRAAAFMIAAICCLNFTGCKASQQRSDFKKGAELYNEGHLDEAKEKFILAGDYGDGAAADFVKNIEDCQKLLKTAEDFISRFEYKQAQSCLDAIPFYDKAERQKAYIEDLCRHYLKAVGLFEDEDYLTAKKEFELSREYDDSRIYIGKIDRMNKLYGQAKDYMKSDDYMNAVMDLRSIGASFEDTDALIAECARILGEMPTAAKLYERYYNDEYPDGAVELNIGEVGLGFVIYDTSGLLFNAALDENGGIKTLSIWISPQIALELGNGINGAAARCIHAINPYFTDLDKLETEIKGYFDVEKPYGRYRVKAKTDSGGAVALNIIFAEP